MQDEARARSEALRQQREELQARIQADNEAELRALEDKVCFVASIR